MKDYKITLIFFEFVIIIIIFNNYIDSIYLFIYLFIFGCVGPLLLRTGFL